jgi:hypothetical protein
MTNKALTQGRLIQFIQLSAIIHLQDEHSITITRYAEQSIILSLHENHTWHTECKRWKIYLEVGERALGDHPQSSGKNHGMILIQRVLRAKGLH